MNKLQRTLAIAAAAFCAVGAQAATLYTTDFTSAGWLVSPDSLSTSFSTSAASNATIDFKLAGYYTLDGDNDFIDIFHLSVNGTEVFTGTFDLGGGGANRVLLAPAGSTVTRLADKLLDISVPLSLLAGANTISFSYTSPTVFEGIARDGAQGIGDEGWGVHRVSISGTDGVSVSAVPEPQTYALLLAGLGVVGMTMARRQRDDR